ncbi:hypothetical protein QYF36_010661 [Acer negundo]|nr:hypothetical protein QYF36_010661 [Acer negundo]
MNGLHRGFLIPKGWKVLPLFRNLHHNLDFFTDPLVFDPSRFEVRSGRVQEWGSVQSIPDTVAWTAG